MEATLIVRVLTAVDGEVTQVDCIPNINEIPDGTLRRAVMTMLHSLPGNWRQTIDKRQPPLRLTKDEQ